jgi:uncharacterized protein (TIRG00374 family)
MRKFLLALILFLTVSFIITRTADIQAVIATLQQGDWRFLLMGFLLMLASIVVQALVFKAIYRGLGIKESLKSLLPVVSSAYFLSTIAPSGGVSGMAIFVVEADRRGYSPARAAVAGALYILFDYAAFICVLILGLIVLFRRNNLNAGEIIATVLLLALMIGLFTLVFLGLRSEKAFSKVLIWLAHRANRILKPFVHRDYLSENRAGEFAHEASGGLHEIARETSQLIRPFAFALARQTLQVSILFMMFLAFQVPVSPGTVIAGYSISALFLIISITPQGLGVIEGILPLVLKSMYVQLGAGTVITLAYRSFTLWIPFAIGAIAFRLLGFSRELHNREIKAETKIDDHKNGQGEHIEPL